VLVVRPAAVTPEQLEVIPFFLQSHLRVVVLVVETILPGGMVVLVEELELTILLEKELGIRHQLAPLKEVMVAMVQVRGLFVAAVAVELQRLA
jgi:hypothetical protein